MSTFGHTHTYANLISSLSQYTFVLDNLIMSPFAPLFLLRGISWLFLFFHTHSHSSSFIRHHWLAQYHTSTISPLSTLCSSTHVIFTAYFVYFHYPCPIPLDGFFTFMESSTLLAFCLGRIPWLISSCHMHMHKYRCK